MTKRKSTPSPAASKPRRTAGSDTNVADGERKWHGDEVQPRAAGTAETPEQAAARAEGNAPLTAAGAIDRARQAGAPETYGLKTGPEKDRAMPARDVDNDDDENVEEKREAALEDHAEQPSRHSPHGKL